MVAQSAPPMPETVTVAQAAPPVPASTPEVVLSFSPARQARPAVSLPATGPSGTADPAIALLASVLVALGSGLVWVGRQRSSSAT
jgi:LPXTG-motif cell wall-anchored protein